MIVILIYFFFEKIKYDIQAPLYESKVFWIAVALFIFFSGIFLVLIYSKTLINDLKFREQYFIIYNTFNIIKNIFFCVALIIKGSNTKDKYSSDSFNLPPDHFYPFNNPNS